LKQILKTQKHFTSVLRSGMRRFHVHLAR